MEVVSHPYPESKQVLKIGMFYFQREYLYLMPIFQLIVNHEYDINITIFDADDHVIYPSENILTKTTFGKQFDVIDISVRNLFQAKLHSSHFSRSS